jgi:hypothetical protein
MNWGTKLTIGLAVFMVFILGLCARIFFFTNTDDLVENDYYEKGEAYESEYREQLNARNDPGAVQLNWTDAGLQLHFMNASSYQLILRHPYDAKGDEQLNGAAGSNQKILVPRRKFVAGNWRAELRWTSGSTVYRVKKEIHVR